MKLEVEKTPKLILDCVVINEFSTEAGSLQLKFSYYYQLVVIN
jgi:hypothetical protein